MIEYWDPSTCSYSQEKQGIGVLTYSKDCFSVDDLTRRSLFLRFRELTGNALSYINHTTTGKLILRNLADKPVFIAPITNPTLCNMIRETESNLTTNLVATELLLGSDECPRGGIVGHETKTALKQLYQTSKELYLARYLRADLVKIPNYPWDPIQGDFLFNTNANATWVNKIKRARRCFNRWSMVIDPRYFRWHSDMYDGYFKSQTFFNVSDLYINNIELSVSESDICYWIMGGKLPKNLSEIERTHILLSVIILLEKVSPRNMGCRSAIINWNSLFDDHFIPIAINS